MGQALNQKQKKAILSDFGHNVEALIYKKFKNKEEFLRATGIYRKTLHDILTGTKDARISTVYKLAEAIGVHPRELLPK